LKIKNLYNIGGTLLSTKYNDSPATLLATVYPENEWLPWRFVFCPSSFWSEVKNQRNFMDWVGKQLGINDMSDWYRVSKEVTKNQDFQVENIRI
jgi:hypothetical protein